MGKRVFVVVVSLLLYRIDTTHKITKSTTPPCLVEDMDENNFFGDSAVHGFLVRKRVSCKVL